MKRQAFMILTTLSFLVMLAATSVYAQVTDLVAVAKIPFEFSVGKKVLPAGEYSISKITGGALVIRNADFSASAIFFTITIPRAGTTRSQSSLVFHRYGNQYFLSKIWTDQVETGRELFESRAEGELIRATSALVKGDASKRKIVSIPAIGSKR